MTQEEFLNKYKGKFVEITTTDEEEVVWAFNVTNADFSGGNGLYLGDVFAERFVFGYPDRVEKYTDSVIVLRPGDLIKEYKNQEELQKRILEYVKKNIA